MLCDNELRCAVQIRTLEEGVVTIGDYRRVLHANRACGDGERLIVTAYCSQTLVDLVGSQ